jgi:hypothetical protein
MEIAAECGIIYKAKWAVGDIPGRIIPSKTCKIS